MSIQKIFRKVPRILWVLVPVALVLWGVAIVIVMVPRQAAPAGKTTPRRIEAATNNNEAIPPPLPGSPAQAKSKVAFAATAAEYRPGAPRRRDELGSSLPFREKKLSPAAMEALRASAPGSRIEIELFPGVTFTAAVTGRWEDQGETRIAAALEGQPEGDRLFMTWKGAIGRGDVLIPSRNVAYEILLQESGYTVLEWLYTDRVCSRPSKDGLSAINGLSGAETDAVAPKVVTAASIDPGSVPVLNSRPGATSVIYLDFDGETVSGTGWAGGATIVAPSAQFTVAQIKGVFDRVVANYSIYEVNVTTQRSVHDAAPIDRRTHCIITSNRIAAADKDDPTGEKTDGIAFMDSFTHSVSSTKVCWAFDQSSAANCAFVISHEVGHTLGLDHDGTGNGTSTTDPNNLAYYSGHGNWGPIMGEARSRDVQQWSKGEYALANNPQDDVEVMTQASFLGFVFTRLPRLPDDHGDTLANATPLSATRFSEKINTRTDVDVFRVDLPAGNQWLYTAPGLSGSALDLEFQAFDAAGALIASSSPSGGVLWSSLSFTLSSSQPVYLRVDGVGEGNPLNTGYSDYGSLGAYDLELPATAIPQGSCQAGRVSPGAWMDYEVYIPSGSPGWRLVLAPRNGSAGNARLYVRKWSRPTEIDYFRAAGSRQVETIVLNSSEATQGTWYVSVYLPPGTSAEDFRLKSEVGWLRDLTWDPGTAELGTQVYSVASDPQDECSTIGGTHYFRITTPNSQLGLWRQVLRVTGGEADLYAQRDSPAGPENYSTKSERIGSDGLVSPLSSSSGAGQTWYLTVEASNGATWSLFAGDIYVRDLGALAAGESSGSGADAMPIEGWRFYRTSMPNNTLAWRMWLQQADATTTWNQTFRVRKNNIPHPALGTDREFTGQALEVPPYLAAGGNDAYFVSVQGEPATSFRFDSRHQEITDIAFGTTSSSIPATGYLFRTFRINVPPDRLGWETTALREAGDPSIAVRRAAVPNARQNDAYSEVAGAVDDSVTLVQPSLADGTFFATIYSSQPYTCRFRNADPSITQIPFTGNIANNDPNRSGWRYYKMLDDQISLGWLLSLANQAPGTKIALRRNLLPGEWSYRDDGSASGRQLWDYVGTGGNLQRPGHQADVWYVGIYKPESALGAFTLTTGALTATPVDMRTMQSVNALGVGEWKYYRIDVPAQINGQAVRGWELRATQWTNGLGVSIRRDQLPTATWRGWWDDNFGGPGTNFKTATVWPSGRDAFFGSDWTGRNNPSSPPVLSMGMGQPLEPGTYYVGFYNGGSVPLPFAWTSKVMGDEGSGLDYEIKPLAFGGSVSGALAPRGVAYYYVDVPAGKASQKFRLSLPAGHEGQMYIRKDQLPNIHGGHLNAYWYGGVMKKDGGEYWLQLPDNGQAALASGRYYVMVVGEGQNPPDSNTLGAGNINFTLDHLGEAPLEDMGTLPVAGTASVNGSYNAGEVKLHRFTLPQGVLALEVRLENRVGAPMFSVRRGEQGPSLYFNFNSAYGYATGYSGDSSTSESLVNVANPQPGVYTVAVGHRGDTAPQVGTYTLRVTTLAPAVLSATGAGSASAALELSAGQSRYFLVDVPAESAGEQVLGWKVALSQFSGSARFRVAKGMAPGSAAGNNQTDWTTGELVVAPGLFSPGTWYVELQGVSAANASVTSSLIVPSAMVRQWTMPAKDQATAHAGLTGAEFGDTGTDANGAALPGDRGTDLAAGACHIYSIDVPENNGGMLRTVLQAIGGNPNIYIRPSQVPSLNHNAVPGTSGAAYLHRLDGSTQSEYGTWVPVDVRYQSILPPGKWYLMVHAAGGTNARYRLRLSHHATSLVQDLALAGGNVANQQLVGSDWRYYRVQMPANAADMPSEWTVTLSQSLGNVRIYLRDTAPPGHYATASTGSDSLRDWTDDSLNPGAYAEISTPGAYVFQGRHLRPGKTYYLGARADSDATFSLSSAISATKLGATHGFPIDVISATGGTAAAALAAGETRTWQVESVAEATRWRHTSTHGSVVQVYLRENFLPVLNTGDSSNFWRSSGASNSTHSSDYGTNRRTRTFYLSAVNTSSGAQNFSATIDWRQYSLTLQATNGSVSRNPSQTLYDYGAVVRLTATPSAGYQFNGWSGDASGTNNPLDVILDTNKTVTANFGPLQRTLTLSPTNGTISLSPAKTTYNNGETVTLTAIPNSGYEFAGWSGDLAGTNNPATLVMSANRTVSAVFSLAFTSSALSPSGLTFTRGGNANWFMQTEVKPTVATSAARSGNTAHSSTSYMETTVTGPGTMTYWRKVSSENNYDFLRAVLDGVQVAGAEWSGEQDWAQQTLSIPAGAHTVRWQYSKDSSVNSGMDAAFIAQVVYVGPGFSSWSIAPLLPENRRGPLDRNGPMNLPNFLSYSMALDPRTATPADMPALGQRGTDTMKFIFRRAKNLSDADLRIMSSTNLSAPWSAADVRATTILQDGGDHEKVETTVGMPQGATRFFLRLQAEQR